MQKLLGVPRGVLREAARVLLVALSVTTLGPALHGVHDTACDPIVVFHDASQHHFAAPSTDTTGPVGREHCVACHFLRTSRGPVSWEPCGLRTLSAGQLLFHSNGQPVAAPTGSPQPARAPPLT